MRKLFILVVFLLFLFQPFIAIAIAVESQPNDQDGLALEIFQMTQTLEGLIQQFKSQQSKISEYQKLQTAISYLSFRSRTIEMLKYDLRFKKERRETIESNIERIKDDPDAWDKLVKGFQAKTPNSSSEQSRPSELRLKLYKDKLDGINSEIIALETEIQGLLDELSTFESYVQEKLGLISSR